MTTTTTENPGALVVEAIRSKHGPSYKLRISGKAGRIEVAGETGTFYLGLGEVTWGAVMDNTQTRIHRAGGGALPPGAMRKVQDAVYAKLQTLETNPGRKRSARRNPKMAKRYIGDATISISLQDDDSYAGTISIGRKRWKFEGLNAPRAGLGEGVAYDSAEAYDEMAQAAVSFGAYYTSHNRGDDTPDWAPKAETADAIEEATAWATDEPGRYEVRRSKAKKNPSRRRAGPAFTYTGPRGAQPNRGPKGGAVPRKQTGETWVAYHDRLSAEARKAMKTGKRARADFLEGLAGQIAHAHKSVRTSSRPKRRSGPGTYPWKQCIADAIAGGARSPRAVCGAIRARSQRTYPDYWKARDPGRRPAR